MVGEEPFDRSDLLRGGRVQGKAHIDDASMSVPMLEDQFPEIAVTRDEDSVLSDGNGQHFVIWKAGGMILADPGCVVADAVQKDADPGLSTLVEQESRQRA